MRNRHFKEVIKIKGKNLFSLFQQDVFQEKVWPTLLFIVAIIASAFQAGRFFLEGDTFWHIKTGQWILENKKVPLYDPFSWSAYGNPWTAHEWLWDLLAGLSWNTAGKWGLWVLMLIGIFLFGLALWAILKQITTPLVASILSGLVLLAVPSFWCARPHVLATGLFAIWIALLMFGQKRPRLLYWLIPVIVLWVNVHSSVILGLGFIVIALISNHFETKSTIYQRTLLLVFLICLLAVCLSPQGVNIYSYTVKVVTDLTMMDNIAEWHSPDFHSLSALPFLIMIGFTFCLLFQKKHPIPLFHKLLLLITLVMSLLQLRQIPLFYFSAAILIAGQLPLEQYINPKSLKLLSITLIAALLFTAWPFQVAWMDSPREGKPYPEQALKYIKKHGYTDHILNDYSWGGYLIFNDIKPFVDGRADMYVFSGTKVFQDYIELQNSSSTDPLQILDKYKIETVLIPPSKSLRWKLEHAPGWRKAYLDNEAVVFVR